MRTTYIWSNKVRSIIMGSFCSECGEKYRNHRIYCFVTAIDYATEQVFLTCKNCGNKWDFRLTVRDDPQIHQQVSADELIEIHEMLSRDQVTLTEILAPKKRS